LPSSAISITSLIALVVRSKTQRALLALAGALAFWSVFNAVADSVADQMCDGFRELVENAFVEVGVLPG